jgi:hypothetical protein
MCNKQVGEKMNRMQSELSAYSVIIIRFGND